MSRDFDGEFAIFRKHRRRRLAHIALSRHFSCRQILVIIDVRPNLTTNGRSTFSGFALSVRAFDDYQRRRVAAGRMRTIGNANDRGTVYRGVRAGPARGQNESGGRLRCHFKKALVVNSKRFELIIQIENITHFVRTIINVVFSVTIAFNRICMRSKIDFEIKTYENSLPGSAAMFTISKYIDFS